MRAVRTGHSHSIQRFDQAASLLGKLGGVLKKIPSDIKEETQEIRLRTGRPVTLCTHRRTWFLTGAGALLPQDSELCPITDSAQMQEVFQGLCSYSVYSHEQEIREGYLVLRGGHRAGICGTASLHQGAIQSLRDISSICIRIAREKPGAADEIFRRLGHLETGLLIAGAPASGKTTVLRDLARQLASGGREGYRRVAVVDQRGELGNVFQGVPGNDLGISSDLLSGYPKVEGIQQAVRVLSPEYIICDELGGEEDARAVEAGMFSGVTMIATLHAGSRSELCRRPVCRRMLETGAFGYVVLLEGRQEPGKVSGILKVGDLLDEAAGAYFPDGGMRRYRAGGVA